MTTIRFQVADAAAVRFAVSPLQETSSSLYTLNDPLRQAVHQPWVDRARVAGADPEVKEHLELLSSFARPGTWTPDFLDPAPAVPEPDIEAELAVVAATPEEIIRADLLAIAGQAPLPPAGVIGLNRPRWLADRLVEALRVWHRVAVAPHWSRMADVMAADMAHRSAQLTGGGVREVIGHLHPMVRWDDDRMVAVDLWDHEVDLAGRGLPLVPSVFAQRRVVLMVSEESPPMMAYPVRGAATVWESAPPAGLALIAVLGDTRARLLTMLRTPATTTDAARRVGRTAAAVSHHLKALHAAGLVGRVRRGRGVHYGTTEAGLVLLDAARRHDT